MIAKNDITGDSIKTKSTSKAYSDNYDSIFRKKTPKEVDDAIAEDEAFKLIDNTGVTKNEYQDILSTEEAIIDQLEKTNNRV